MGTDEYGPHPMENPEYAEMVAEQIASLTQGDMVYLLASWAWLCPNSFREGLARLPEYV